MNKGLLDHVKKYNFNKVFGKNFSLIFTLIVIPLLCINLWIYYYSNQITIDEITSMNQTELERIRNSVDRIIKDMKELANVISNERNVRIFNLSTFEEEQYFFDGRKILETIGQYVTLYDYVQSIYIYSESKKYIIASDGGGYINKFHDISWLDMYYDKKDQQYFWIQSRLDMSADNPQYYFLSLVYPIRIIDDKSLGAVVINIDIEKLRNIINEDNKKKGGYIYIR